MAPWVASDSRLKIKERGGKMRAKMQSKVEKAGSRKAKNGKKKKRQLLIDLSTKKAHFRVM